MIDLEKYELKYKLVTTRSELSIDLCVSRQFLYKRIKEINSFNPNTISDNSWLKFHEVVTIINYLKERGISRKALADKLDISTKTIQRRITRLNKIQPGLIPKGSLLNPKQQLLISDLED